MSCCGHFQSNFKKKKKKRISCRNDGNIMLRKQYCSFLRNCWKRLTVIFSIVLSSDKDLEIEGENGIIHATVSLILSQAVMHAAEHKGQIAAIMKQHGHHVDLDSLDVWSFIHETKNK
jgi:hypothetical protein